MSSEACQSERTQADKDLKKIRNSLLSANRIVIKLGTQVFVQISELDSETETVASDRSPSPFQALMNQCIELVNLGKELIIVSSGAVALGENLLNLKGQLSLSEKQACASAGQSLLMEQYRKGLESANLVPAQVLLTAYDFSHREHYLNLRQTLETLLKHHAIPVINENDTTSTFELETQNHSKGFGDNDMLSALVASRLDADLLVILTNVDAVYTDNPAENPEAKPLTYIEDLSCLDAVKASGQSSVGRGGMTTKLESARVASLSGVTSYITSGVCQEPLSALFPPGHPFNLKKADQPKGTVIAAQNALNGKKRWIGIASGYHGVVVLNDNACTIMKNNRASLLAVGITEVYGQFPSDSVISVQDSHGNEIGRGISNFSSEALTEIKGLKSDEIQETLVYAKQLEHLEVIHRNNLVIFDGIGLTKNT